MLERLLEKLRHGGTHTTAGLARELGVSEPLLGMMLEDLARMGYLEPVGGDCAGGCRACPVAGACTVGGLGRVWKLTGKGALERPEA